MSTQSHHHTPRGEASGEQIFFTMAAAFGVLIATIIGGAFLPVVAGVAVIFAVLAVVLVLVGVFLARILGQS